jgi:hypothetical protein
MDTVFIEKCRYEIQEKEFRYGIPAYTDPFQALYQINRQHKI